MKILLIDIDSTMPNLALMKISAWYKSQGHEVGFKITEPDKVFASCIYKKNIHKLDGCKTWYKNIEIGGTGYSLKKILPDHIENMCPDYELYPNIDYSMGFTSRGCDRNCCFCIVNKKEGNWKKWHDPYMFVRHNKVKLLDNNITWNKDHFLNIMFWAENTFHKLDITQGLDIRCMDKQMFNSIKNVKFWKPIHFAYDHISLRNIIKEKIDIMKSIGMEKLLRNNCYFFVYCHDDSQFTDTLLRCNDLKSWGTNAFVMFNIDNKKTQRIKDLQRWANKPWIFWSCDFIDYKKGDY